MSYFHPSSEIVGGAIANKSWPFLRKSYSIAPTSAYWLVLDPGDRKIWPNLQKKTRIGADVVAIGIVINEKLEIDKITCAIQHTRDRRWMELKIIGMCRN